MAKRRRPRYDLELILQSASGRWESILHEIAGIPAELLDGRHHPCPSCGGEDRFRFTDFRDKGAAICNQCFKSKNSDGFGVIAHYAGIGRKEAIAKVAEYLQIRPEFESRSKSPSDSLTFVPWNPSFVFKWARAKNTTIQAIESTGAKLALHYGRYLTIAFPILSPPNTEPVGYLLVEASGGKLPILNGKGAIVRWEDKKLAAGSKPGLIGRFNPSVPIPGQPRRKIFKSEGLTDLLATLALPDLPNDVQCVTNANGTQETPSNSPTTIAWFAGSETWVCHDCDEPGQSGATWVTHGSDRRPGWSTAIASVAATCKNVVLPYPIVPTHGKDIRDWIVEGNTWADFLTLADSFEPISADQESSPWVPREADDDPHRLARVFFAGCQQRKDDATMVFWRQQWFGYSGTHYRPISNAELAARVNQSIREEYVRINLEQQQDESADEIPYTRKVLPTTVTATVKAMESTCLVRDNIEPNTWLDGRFDKRYHEDHRRFLALRNGILDLSALVYGIDDVEDLLLPHSDQWFSTNCLPYDFDPEAKCDLWERVIRHNVDYREDVYAFLQEWMGYLLIPDTSESTFLICSGDGGNGKSVFFAVVTAMLGKANISAIPLEEFSDKYALTETMGKLANISADAAEIDRAAEGKIKALTTGDPVTFPRKYRESITIKPQARLMIGCNTLPQFKDRTDGVWRRMRHVRWNVRVTDDIKIKGLDDPQTWIENGECPGILAWALRGLMRLKAQKGFTKMADEAEMLEEYRMNSDPSRAFIFDHLIPAEKDDKPIIKNALYQAYRAYCQAQGTHPLSQPNFNRQVKQIFPNVEEIRPNQQHLNKTRKYCWSGIGLSDLALPDGINAEELVY